MHIIIFLIQNLIVILSAFILTYKFFRIAHFTDGLISWFILYFAQIVSTELILGIFGLLDFRNLILLNALILLFVWLICRRQKSSFAVLDLDSAFLDFLNNKIILFAAFVIFGFFLVKVFINLVNPPFGWDSLNYHFTFPVEWLKHKNLENPITVFDDPSPTYYPINGSLFYLWFILPLGNVFFADLGQIPFFILCFLSVYSISRKIGLNKESSFYACALFLLIPNFFKQLEIAYVDVMVAGLFLSALNYLFSLERDFSRRNIVLFALNTGLLLGTKTLALPYSGLLIMPFLYLCLKNAKKCYFAGTFFILLLIFGGFTYVRNFLAANNPLYPLDLKLSEKTIFKGVMDSVAYRAHFKIEDYRLEKLLFHEGLGAQSIIFIFPSLFLALPLALWKRKRISFIFGYLLVLPFLIWLVYRYIIPLANVRYLYPLLGIGSIIGLYTAGILSIPKRILQTLIVLCILGAFPELATHLELVSSVLLSIFAFFISLKCVKYFIGISESMRKIIIAAVFIFLIIGAIFLEKDYARNEYARYIKMQEYSGFWPDATRAWDWLNKNTIGNNIAYAGRPVPFPLYGSNFKNNVYYVSVNRTEPAKLHYFKNSHYCWGYDFESLHKNLEASGNYRSGADYSVWLGNLMRRNTDYLFIYSLHQTKELEFPIEDKWAKDNPDKFIPVFSNATVNIYKIAR